MDVLYLVGPTGPADHVELRYSLRSIHANLIGLERVILVGHAPDWYRGEHIPVMQDRHHWENQIYLLQSACSHLHTPERFLLMNDDFYCMRPTDSVPVWHNGPLRDLLRRYPGGYYRKATRNTLALLAAAGIDAPLAYDGMHLPMPIHRDAMSAVLHRLRPPLQHRSLYGNLTHLGGLPGTDAKRYTPGARWLSTSENCGDVWQHIYTAMRTPSPHEAHPVAPPSPQGATAEEQRCPEAKGEQEDLGAEHESEYAEPSECAGSAASPSTRHSHRDTRSPSVSITSSH